MRGYEDLPVDWAPADVWMDSDGNCQQCVRFIVPGIPKPKGNILRGRWGGYHDTTVGLDDWLDAVSAQAKAAMRGDWRRRVDPTHSPWNLLLKPFCGSVWLYAEFVMPVPKIHAPPKWLKDDRQTWKSLFVDGIPPHLKKPDTSKLLRGIEDAMTGIVWHDDSQVVKAIPTKRYAYLDEKCGVIVCVTSGVDDDSH